MIMPHSENSSVLSLLPISPMFLNGFYRFMALGPTYLAVGPTWSPLEADRRLVGSVTVRPAAPTCGGAVGGLGEWTLRSRWVLGFLGFWFFNLLVVGMAASNILKATSDGLQPSRPSSDGLQPRSGLQPSNLEQKRHENTIISTVFPGLLDVYCASSRSAVF